MAPTPASLPTRRAVLLAVPAAVALAALSSCSSGHDAPAPPPAAEPDVALRAAAVARERVLIRAYDAALLAVPSLTDRLLVLRAEHHTHLTALGAAPGSPAASPAAPGPALLLPSPLPLPAPGVATARLAGLRSAERVAGSGHTADLRTASAGLAVVLATLAASEAAHEVALA